MGRRSANHVNQDARQAAERAARTSYGRLISILASRTRDIAASEDALTDAFASALAVWPERGMPDKPEAWLLTAARRNLIHGARHRDVQRDAVTHLIMRIDERADAVETSRSIGSMSMAWCALVDSFAAAIVTPR